MHITPSRRSLRDLLPTVCNFLTRSELSNLTRIKHLNNQNLFVRRGRGHARTKPTKLQVQHASTTEEASGNSTFLECEKIPRHAFKYLVPYTCYRNSIDVALQARIPERCPVRYKCATKRENSSVLRRVSSGTSAIQSVKLSVCLFVCGWNLSACLPACLCLPGGDNICPKYSPVETSAST